MSRSSPLSLQLPVGISVHRETESIGVPRKYILRKPLLRFEHTTASMSALSAVQNIITYSAMFNTSRGTTASAGVPAPEAGVIPRKLLHLSL